MKPLWQLVVKPARDAGETGSGIIIPDLKDSYDPSYRISGNENRPTSGIVVATPVFGFMQESEKGAIAVRDGMNSIHRSVRRQRDWKMPEAGDTVCFGFSDWEWPGEDQAFMFPDNIHCVIPKYGNPWGMGEWALLDQIPEAATTQSGIVVHTGSQVKLSRGIVRMVGAGFTEGCPSITPGTLVVFKSWGGSNTVCPNPFGGRDMTRITPSMVVAIDNAGISEEEYRALVMESEKIQQEANAARRLIRTDNFLNDHKARGEEQREANTKKAQRNWDRKYYGHRNTY